MSHECQTEIFRDYANVYDSLYSEKDYESECDFMETVFRHFGNLKVRDILDLGCGTGGHAIPLAQRGYNVLGVDQSAGMLDCARQKVEKAQLSEKVRFVTANIQEFRLNKEFEAVICMFAVLSYQTSNAGLMATLNTVRRHLSSGGLFICDFWYGPAVLSQRPEDRVKSVHKGEDRIIRIVKPKMDTQKNVVEVHYEILRLREDRLINEYLESHAMRFLFKPEIEFYLDQTGFSLVHFCPFADTEKEVGESTWNVVTISRAI